MKVLATYNLKGGVGKTAAAVNLGYLAARSGFRTLVCDLDPQGAATYCFRVKAKVKGGSNQLLGDKWSWQEHIRATDYDGLDLLPSDFSYRHLDILLGKAKDARRLNRRVRSLADHYDYLFLDCAPSISLVSEAVFFLSDVLVVPTIPTTLSRRTLKQLAKHLRTRAFDVQVLTFFSMVDNRKLLHREICEHAEDLPFPVLRTMIPCSSEVEQMSAKRAPLLTFSQTGAAARAYVGLWSEIAGLLTGGVSF